ncbi:hypothetical protein [uncultured Amaricoccus sp.]|uniref:hypothetical protein n=1 Tax=uncultured Amaricoccus sp. TaxID=339341 RepID=UPI00260F8283|nr:hypothetical protein [uncultured Amaricoccus sp.]
MTRNWILLLPFLLPIPAAAGALTDLLMAPHLFEAEPAGVAVAYAEERSVPEREGMTVADVTAGELRLEVVPSEEGHELRLVREVGGAAKPLGTFGVEAANPVLLYFLETTVRVMAEATGGNPYYIRNRIREALAAAGLGEQEGTVREVLLAPFAADANRARMGVFGDLSIRLRFDPEAPARILELSADTPGEDGRYHEKMVLVGEK